MSVMLVKCKLMNKCISRALDGNFSDIIKLTYKKNELSVSFLSLDCQIVNSNV